MSLCILAAGKTTVLAVAAFTLSWTHSVEKTRWEEDWRVTPAGLEIVEARVKGSGAGMEPPEGAVLKDGWWTYAPKIGPRPAVMLAASGATGGRLDAVRRSDLPGAWAEAGEPVELSACIEPREPRRAGRRVSAAALSRTDQ